MPHVGIICPIMGYDAEETKRREEIYASYLPSNYTVSTIRDTRNPKFFNEQSDFDVAVANTASFFAGIDPSEFDVLIYSGAIDPALPAARKACRVPIVGSGESAMLIGHLRKVRASIISINQQSTVMTQPFIDQTATKPEIASIVTLDLSVMDIKNDMAGARDQITEAARVARDRDGATAVYYGSVSLGFLDVTHRIQRDLGLIVLDPIRASAAVAAQTVFAVTAP